MQEPVSLSFSFMINSLSSVVLRIIPVGTLNLSVLDFTHYMVIWHLVACSFPFQLLGIAYLIAVV